MKAGIKVGGFLLMFVTGAACGGVTVGSSSLIGTLQYSDTFTVGSAVRSDGGVPANPAGLIVEKSYGTPTRSWAGLLSSSLNTDSTAHPDYPGGSGAGSATGMTQNGDPIRQTTMFQYNSLGSDFVIQFDATQTAGDRVSIFLSDSTNPYGGTSLGIFFRPTGTRRYYELGIYNPALGEVNSGLATGIADAAKWNNYAVHLKGSSATFYVNEVSLGTIDLATFSPGKDYSGYSTTYIGFGVDGAGIKWVDNFQVGRAASSERQ